MSTKCHQQKPQEQLQHRQQQQQQEQRPTSCDSFSWRQCDKMRATIYGMSLLCVRAASGCLTMKKLLSDRCVGTCRQRVVCTPLSMICEAELLSCHLLDRERFLNAGSVAEGFVGIGHLTFEESRVEPPVEVLLPRIQRAILPSAILHIVRQLLARDILLSCCLRCCREVWMRLLCHSGWCARRCCIGLFAPWCYESMLRVAARRKGFAR